MNITHHPDIASLMSCSAGSMPEPLAAVMASHISICPECRAELKRMEQIGIALLEKLPIAAMHSDLPDMSVRGSLAVERFVTVPVTDAGEEVPAPLANVVGGDLDKIAWKRLGPGLWHYPLALSKGVPGDLRLIKVAPGQVLPDHGHGGSELTLVLRGAYQDKVGRFAAGDVADLDEEIEHQPVADKDEGCICLIAAEKKAKFKSLLARLVQPLTGM